MKKTQKRLKRFRDGIDEQTEDGIHQFAGYAEGKIKMNAVFTRGYSKGNLRRQIYSENLPMSAFIGSPAYYSGWVEWGTRYMDAQPFFYNTLNEIKYDLGKFIMKR